jgi:hypothetical protein
MVALPVLCGLVRLATAGPTPESGAARDADRGWPKDTEIAGGDDAVKLLLKSLAPGISD